MKNVRGTFLKLFTHPGTTAAALRGGGAGWAAPAAVFLAAAFSSALLAGRVPQEFLADAAGGARLTQARGFLAALPVCLLGAFGFTAFFAALLCAFAPFLDKGRMARRLPALLLAPAVYGFFFLLPLGEHAAYRAAQWLCAAGAAAFAARAAYLDRRRYAPLLQMLLVFSVLTLASDAVSWAAVLAGSVSAYTGGQYLFAFVSLVYMARAAAGLFGTTTSKAAAASVAALLGAAVFIYSLLALGLISADTFQALMLT